MRETTAFEKLAASLINILIVGSIFLIVNQLSLFAQLDDRKLLLGLFLLYSSCFIFINNGRDLGMILIDSYWKEEYPIYRHIIFTMLYVLSFASLLYWVLFPFDLLLINLLLLQLPTILIKKTTLHGYLAGNMVTVRRKR